MGGEALMPPLLHPCLQAEDMIAEIRTAFEESLDQLDWMDEKTRNAAKEKVLLISLCFAVVLKIGRGGNPIPCKGKAAT